MAIITRFQPLFARDAASGAVLMNFTAFIETRPNPTLRKENALVDIVSASPVRFHSQAPANRQGESVVRPTPCEFCLALSWIRAGPV